MSEELLRALPLWQGEIVIEPLSGGLTNLNYRVTDGNRCYAARSGRDDPALGIDRGAELTCTRFAADQGIAPAVAHSAPGLLVCEFVENATTLTPELARQPTRIAHIAATLRQIHATGPTVVGHLPWFSPFQVARTYLALALQNDLALPTDDAGQLQQQIQGLQARIGPFQPTFTHNDMMPGNLLERDGRLWVIDWEYSGIGHPLFDLAGLSSNCDYDDALDDRLLEAYGAGSGQSVEFRIMKSMAALRESLWAVVQGAQTEIEFDYDGYRDDNYRKFIKYADTAR